MTALRPTLAERFDRFLSGLELVACAALGAMFILGALFWMVAL